MTMSDQDNAVTPTPVDAAPIDAVVPVDEVTPIDVAPAIPFTEVPQVAAVQDDTTSVPASADLTVDSVPNSDAAGPTPAPDSGDTFVAVNLDVGTLRFRADASTESDVVDALADGTVLRVINDENPDWLFVEIAGEDSPRRGYVKKVFVVETPAPDSV